METELNKNREILQVLMIVSSISPMINQLLHISNGSRSMMEQSGVLAQMYKKIGDLSLEYQNILSKPQTADEIEQFSQYYDNEILQCYRILMPAIESLRKNSLSNGFPRQMLGTIVTCIQQIENGMESIMQIVDKQNARNGYAPQTLSPVATKDATDEQELVEIYDSPGRNR